MVELEVDGQSVRVFEGATILDACTSSGIDTPTLCYGETLQPANVCRVCVVELEGARVLAPSCSRKVEGGHEGPHRLRARPPLAEARDGAPRLVGRPLDDAGGARLPRPLRRRARALRPARAAGRRPRPRAHRPPRRAGRPDRRDRHQPVKVDNELYVRDYAKCILCYKCVDACGEQYQNTFAIHVAGRGFDARISTELDTPLPESACVYCGNCIAVCPTGALMFRSEHELREAGEWREDEQTVTETICPYCGVGCSLELHVQDNTIVKVTSPTTTT